MTTLKNVIQEAAIPRTWTSFPKDGKNGYAISVHNKWYMVLRGKILGKPDCINGYTSFNRMVRALGVVG